MWESNNGENGEYYRFAYVSKDENPWKMNIEHYLAAMLCHDLVVPPVPIIQTTHLIGKLFIADSLTAFYRRMS